MKVAVWGTCLIALGSILYWRLPGYLRPVLPECRVLGKWLASRSDIRGLIVTTSFSEVSQLFYENDKNTYLFLLDPSFFYDYDREGWRKWQNVVTLRDKNYPQTLRTVFSARYLVVVPLIAPHLAEFVERDPRMKPLYLGPSFGVFAVREETSGYVVHWQISKTYASEENIELSRVAWTSSAVRGDFIDLTQYVEGPKKGRKVFLRSAVSSSGEAKRRFVAVSADDVASLWVNGELAAVDRRRGFLMPDEVVGKCTLRTGWNEFVVGVENNGGEWGFAVRLYDHRSAVAWGDEKKRAKENARLAAGRDWRGG